MKKYIVTIALALAGISVSASAFAQDMDIYVNDQHLVRDIVSVDGFDMLPILDIAGELGFNCYYDGTVIDLYNDNRSYTFTVGDASVYDESGNWYGLDVVPQVINDKIRIPAKFFQDAMGMSYVWDSVTNTIYMGSEDTYNWLINTYEYQHPQPATIEGIYYQYLRDAGSISVYSGETVGHRRHTYDVDELWYYVADINYDGTKDLIVSAEDYNGNGIIVYTYRNGQVVRVVDEGLPYSSGSVLFTLAQKDGIYGILVNHQNSTGSFTFSRIWGNWTPGTDTFGYHYDDDYTLNYGSVSGTVWQNAKQSIRPVAFYNIWTLQQMS